MQTLDMQQADQVGGSNILINLLLSMAMPSFDLNMLGKLDYAGVVEQQGHYYNTVGA